MSHGAAEACIVPEMHASPPDSGRVDQEKQLIVLIYQIRGLVIIVHVPYSHFRSSELFKRRLEDFFLPAGKAPLRHGQVTADHLDGHRANALRPCQLESGECFPGKLARWNHVFAGPGESLDGFTRYKLY